MTAGVVACGMVAGQRREATREGRGVLREETYSKVRDLTRRFETEFGTAECRKLTGCDLLTPEGQAAFKANQANDRVCRPAVRFVVHAAIEVLG